MEGGAVENLRWLPLRAGSGRKEEKRDKAEQKAGACARTSLEISGESSTHKG